jgi:hypothetical protein
VDVTYKLFIDDLRDPITDDWFVARTSYQAYTALILYGVPNEIAFDHDLGDEDTSICFIHKLIDYFLDTGTKFPAGFSYTIHSQNPVGKEAIDSLMKSAIHNIGIET